MSVTVENVTWFHTDQHCTFEYQDGVEDYSFSHTAGYCGKPQERFCGCAFCYRDGFAYRINQIISESDDTDEANVGVNEFLDKIREEENW